MGSNDRAWNKSWTTGMTTDRKRIATSNRKNKVPWSRDTKSSKILFNTIVIHAYTPHIYLLYLHNVSFYHPIQHCLCGVHCLPIRWKINIDIQWQNGDLNFRATRNSLQNGQRD